MARPKRTKRGARDPERDQAAKTDWFIADWGEAWGPFAGEEDAWAYWREHGKRLTREYREEKPWKRPAFWWRFEAGKPMGVFATDLEGIDDYEDFRATYPYGVPVEAVWLEQHGELTDDERAALEEEVEAMRKTLGGAA